MSVKSLIKRVDIEEVLDELGLYFERQSGADAYFLCPHPDHVEQRASFHVCVDDVVDSKGRSRLGWCNCWSHPDSEMQISDFTVLVAKIRSDIWGRDPTPEEVSEARRWLVERHAPDSDVIARRKGMMKRRLQAKKNVALVWPPMMRLSEAPARFSEYLRTRGIGPERAEKLGAAAVMESGDLLEGCLRNTIPGVLLPIRHLGETVSWYVRSIDRNGSGRNKVRYSPGAGLQAHGVLWSPEEPVTSRPVVLVEGIFDADRISQLISKNKLSWEPRNVLSVLGGNLTEAQGRRVKQLCPSKVMVIGDGDQGGKQLVNSVKRHLGEGVLSDTTPIGTDPGDCREEVLVRMLGGEDKRIGTRVLIRKAMR